MAKVKSADLITPAQYLENERTSEMKHEYVDGQTYAMAGASPNHGRISANLIRRLGNQLDNSPCEPFSSDLMLKTPTGQYRYPDVMVVCDDEFIDNGYVTQTPVIIIEILSRSTRKIDERTKQLEYINIPTLKEYVLIEQDIVDIRVLRKSDDWRTSHYYLGESVYFESLDVTLSVEEIYNRVQNQDMTDFLANQ